MAVVLVRRFLSAVLAAQFLAFLARNALSVEIAAPYVPTAPSVVERMLEVAKVGPDDYVIDLGSGDGRIVIVAAKKHGARGHGIEIDPQLVAQANANAGAAGVSDRASFYEADLFVADLSKATVITMYLLTRATVKLRSRLLDLKPGTRIVTNASSMGEWKPDHFEMIEVKDRVRSDAPRKTYIQYWVVPAKVGGVWRWSVQDGHDTRHYELALSQRFQVISGTVRSGDREIAIEKSHLQGDRITVVFNAEFGGNVSEHRLVGNVSGDAIAGTMSVMSSGGPRQMAWNAKRGASADTR